MPRMAISEHAVERFVERVAPDWGYVKARHHLEERCESAVRLPRKTLLGQYQYELDDPRCVLVVKREGGDDVLTCVTILPPRTPNGESPLTEIEEELLRELAERPKPRTANVPPSKKHWRPQDLRSFLTLQRQRLEWEGVALREAEKTERVRLETRQASETTKQRALAIEKKREARKAARASVINGGPKGASEKILRHLATREEDARRYKTALRAALRYLVTCAGAEAVLAEVRAIEAGFLSEGFLNHETKDPGTIVE
jgi:hypothetical protein